MNSDHSIGNAYAEELRATEFAINRAVLPIAGEDVARLFALVQGLPMSTWRSRRRRARFAEMITQWSCCGGAKPASSSLSTRDRTRNTSRPYPGRHHPG